MESSYANEPRRNDVSSSYQTIAQTDVELHPSHLTLRTEGPGTVGVVKRKPLASTSVVPTTTDLWDENHTVQRHHLQETEMTDLGQSKAWKSGFFVRLPILAILALIGVLACTIASIVILCVSDGVDIRNWSSYTPSVYLATFSVIANTLLGFALFEGIVIAFWRKMLIGGTVLELNRNWECGTSIWHALRHHFRAGGRVTSIARLLTTLALFRGPIYQRASFVVPDHTSKSKGAVQVNVAQYLPDGYAGIDYYSHVASREGRTARLTSAFTEILGDYQSNTNMVLEHDGCGNSCSAVIKGFGYKPECSIEEKSFVIDLFETKYADLFETSTSFFEIGEIQPGVVATSFFAGLMLNATFYTGRNEPLNSTANYTQALYRQYMTYHVCNLTGGVMEYSVELQGNTVTLSSRDKDIFLQPVDLITPASNSGQGQTVIGGFQYASDLISGATASLSFTGAVNSIDLTGTLANQMLTSNDVGTDIYGNPFNDPMDIMLETIRNIAFRASLKAGTENTTVTNASQIVSYTGSNTYSIYRTNYTLMAIAVSMSIISIASVAATFNGWWRLGRNMSMNPFEIARAFDAPLMQQAGGNAEFADYPQGIVGRRVRYGASHLFGESEIKRQGSTEEETETETERERLVVSDHGGVGPPKKGAVYI